MMFLMWHPIANFVTAILTVKHIMLECEQLRVTRRACLDMCRRNRAPNMRDLLTKNMKSLEVVYVLKNIGAYNLIPISRRSCMVKM